MAAKPETPFVKACRQYLDLRGIPNWRNNTGAQIEPRWMKYGLSPGSADIVGLIPPYGRFIAVECKVYPNKVTKSQKAWLSTVEDAGGLAVVAYTLDDIQDALKTNESFYRDIVSK